ncbi:glucose-6-phosphate isomerase [Candidatus Pelagibacter sp.]|jgi:glucose-6-phosphate isomerase|nr:glucose-6-phosphate isomerase [Candidatus Pelagibacter sp.]
MLTKDIIFKNYNLKKKKNIKIKKDLILFLNKNTEIIKSLSIKYKNSYKKKTVNKFKKYKNIRVIGIGGSILGTQSIYDFLKSKIKKNFYFIDNLQTNNNFFRNKKKSINLIVSKSGNTLETISNANLAINKKDKNIFISENKDSYLISLANRLKAEIVHHNNFIGGRYSVLSEVGMLPAELMGLNEKKFKQINSLVKNKKFISQLVLNVSNTLYFLKKKKFNSIILNYDEKSNNLFKWYQQLVAESLGKKGKGILPVVSCMPKDNHSLMQLYLDGPKNNFFTFFHVKEKNSDKINNDKIISSYSYLNNKNFNNIIYSQKIATENVFLKKKIPFRSFEILNRSEKVLGELFCFFILETILLGRALNVNPFDQPSVELIKAETKKILIK